jgi:hypothetical protein
MPTQRPSGFRQLFALFFTLLCVAGLSSIQLDAQPASPRHATPATATATAKAKAPASGKGPADAVAHGDADPRAVLRQAIDAMGGEVRLRQIRVLRVEAMGHSYYLDQSERPEGPWIVSYEQRTELRDVEHQRLRQTLERRSIQGSAWAGSTTVVSDHAAAVVRGDKMAPARAAQMHDAADTLALEPERLLFTALDAADLRALPDERLQDVMQRRARFTWNGKSIQLWINAHTLLPTAVDVTADDGTDIWGEVTRRVLFSYWNLESNGLLYPRQRNVLWNGWPQSELSIAALTINPGDVPADAFDIPADVRTAFASAPQMNYRTVPLGQRTPPVTAPAPAATSTSASTSASASSSTPAAEALVVDTLADGVVQIPGLWNVAYVRQADGLVIIEAPLSSEYSAQVLDEAARRFPGMRVKAVITTSDAWPHLAGVREYAARGIPIYALDLNKPILDRLLAARYSARPDRLARAPRAAEFRLVSAKTVIGDGDNRLVLHPIRGENGERMMLVHLPGRRLLYTSDEVMHASRAADTFFMPSYLTEVEAAMRRSGIDHVDTIFGMHLRATPWSVIEATLTKARPEPQ